MSLPRLLFFVRRVGPYHDARFAAAGRELDLTVVETRPGSAEYPWTTAAAARHYRLAAFAPAAVPEQGLRGAALRAEAARVLAEFRPTAIATAGWADPEYHAVLRLASAAGIPAVVMSDSTWADEPRRWWKERLKSAVLRHYTAAVVAGTRSRAYLAGLGFAADAIFEPWDVVDNDYFAAGADQARAAVGPGWGGTRLIPRRFLCVARFIPKKNLVGLLTAYADHVAGAGPGVWALTLAGAGPLEPELRAQAEQLGLGGLVEFAGFSQYPALPAGYARSGALVLPSWSDQWGLVVNEAMAAGLPVIVSDRCGCAPDLVDAGVTGWTFDPGDPAALAAALGRMAALEASAWVAMGWAAQARVAAYSPAAFAAGLARAATRAISGHPVSPPSSSRLLLLLLAARTRAA